MNLHYSQTVSVRSRKENWFDYHMNLHYSQTISDKATGTARFDYHMNLHYSQTFPLFFSFNSDRSNSFRNISSKLSPSLIASYLELCLQSSISLLTLKKPHNATISGTTGQKKRASHSQGSYLIFQVHPDILKYHHSFLQDLP